jgi:hypothetical protein
MNDRSAKQEIVSMSKKRSVSEMIHNQQLQQLPNNRMHPRP